MLTARSIPRVFQSRSNIHMLIAATLFVLLRAASAQMATVDTPRPQQVILSLLQKVQAENAPPAKLGYVWALLASSYQDTGDIDEALQAYNHALPLLAKTPESRANYATALDNLGEVYLESGRASEAERVRMQAFRIRTELGDPVELARSHEHLAEVLLAEHRYKQAEEHAQATADVFAARREPEAFIAVPAQGAKSAFRHGNTLLSAYVTLTYAQCLQSSFASCLKSARLADELVARDFEPDSLERAHVLMALGFAQWKSGDSAAAEHSFLTGLAMMRARLGEGHPVTIESMVEYRDFLRSAHRKDEAASLDRSIQETVALRSSKSCSTCTVSAFALR